MTIRLVLLIQAAAWQVPAPAMPAISLHVRQPCEESSDPDEIVVCGRSSDDRYRLKPIPLPAGMKAPVDRPGVDFDIGNAHGNVHATSVGRQDGLADKRIMVTLTMPF